MVQVAWIVYPSPLTAISNSIDDGIGFDGLGVAVNSYGVVVGGSGALDGYDVVG